MTKVTIEAAPWVMDTAAALLRTFGNRGPSSDRAGIEAIADALEAASAKARADLDAI